MRNIKRMEQVTNEKCDLCGSPLVLKWGKFGSFFACSAYNKKDPTSCTFTKENTAAKPDLNTPEAQEAGEQEEYCENCGRVMVLRRGPFGHVHVLPGVQRRPALQDLPQAQPEAAAEAVRSEPTGEDCPLCGKPLVLRQGAYGEFVSCSGYPKCKYIKQNLIEGMKCPKCGEGDIAERKARRGNVFWGCTNYPKCDFTSNYKPVAKPCPECKSPYLVEKTLGRGSTWSARTRRRAPRKRLPRRSAPRRRGRPAGAVALLENAVADAPIPSGSGTRRRRRRQKPMGRWLRRRTDEVVAARSGHWTPKSRRAGGDFRHCPVVLAAEKPPHGTNAGHAGRCRNHFQAL